MLVAVFEGISSITPDLLLLSWTCSYSLQYNGCHHFFNQDPIFVIIQPSSASSWLEFCLCIPQITPPCSDESTMYYKRPLNATGHPPPQQGHMSSPPITRIIVHKNEEMANVPLLGYSRGATYSWHALCSGLPSASALHGPYSPSNSANWSRSTLDLLAIHMAQWSKAECYKCSEISPSQIGQNLEWIVME